MKTEEALATIRSHNRGDKVHPLYLKYCIRYLRDRGYGVLTLTRTTEVTKQEELYLPTLPEEKNV